MTTWIARRYFIAVNYYRSSCDNGFANAWYVMECHDVRQQRKILRDGLAVRDECGPNHEILYSTCGVRAATPTEIRRAKRVEEGGEVIRLCDEQIVCDEQIDWDWMDH